MGYYEPTYVNCVSIRHLLRPVERGINFNDYTPKVANCIKELKDISAAYPEFCFTLKYEYWKSTITCFVLYPKKFSQGNWDAWARNRSIDEISYYLRCRLNESKIQLRVFYLDDKCSFIDADIQELKKIISLCDDANGYDGLIIFKDGEQVRCITSDISSKDIGWKWAEEGQPLDREGAFEFVFPEEILSLFCGEASEVTTFNAYEAWVKVSLIALGKFDVLVKESQKSTLSFEDAMSVMTCS